ncbi:MAG: metallophosphoesterase [Rhodocyclaceae bacterium]|nr:metallophosphoesterase [Rhodocyclaceae bacterium]
MKIHVLSDIHLEFGKWPKDIDVNAIDADVTVLAGDIGVGLDGLRFALEFKRPVIYVMGNHEYYGQRPMVELWRKARQKVEGTHVHLLENEAVVLDGVRFLGATLWTDFSLFGIERQEEMMRLAQHDMTDYNSIFVSVRRSSAWDEMGGRMRHGGDLLTAKRAVEMHHASRSYLARELNAPGQKTVVVTHHAPSAQSLTYQKPGERLDSAYASHLDDLVAQADLWIHGHTHIPVDYWIGNGRVVSNPRGYMGIELADGFNPEFVVEV